MGSAVFEVFLEGELREVADLDMVKSGFTGEKRGTGIAGCEQIGTCAAAFHDVFVKVWIDGNGVFTRKAGEATLVLRLAGGPHHRRDIEVPNRVSSQIFADLFQ